MWYGSTMCDEVRYYPMLETELVSGNTCLIFTNRKMEHLNNSDENCAAMLTTNAFDNIINEIRSSNLNFQLQISPFSAQISLKRSLIKDKSGILITTPRSTNSPTMKIPTSENLQLEEKLSRALDDANDSRMKLAAFEKRESEDRMKVESQRHDLHNLKVENEKCMEKIIEQEEEIISRDKMIKTKSQIVNKLNKALSEIKIKSEESSALARKILKNEVQSWKKKLGNERKEKIRLEKIINDYEKNYETYYRSARVQV